MRRLTAEQQALVEAHLGAAKVWASLYGWGIPRDDRVSIAFEALCDAATQQPPYFVSFSAWAKLFVKRKLITECRTNSVWLRRNGTNRRDEELDVARDNDLASALDNRTLAKMFRNRFHLLTTAERRTLETYCEGWEWQEVAKRLGYSYFSVKQFRKRAVRKLLDPDGIKQRWEARARAGRESLAKVNQRAAGT